MIFNNTDRMGPAFVIAKQKDETFASIIIRIYAEPTLCPCKEYFILSWRHASSCVFSRILHICFLLKNKIEKTSDENKQTSKNIRTADNKYTLHRSLRCYQRTLCIDFQRYRRNSSIKRLNILHCLWSMQLHSIQKYFYFIYFTQRA